MSATASMPALRPRPHAATVQAWARAEVAGIEAAISPTPPAGLARQLTGMEVSHRANQVLANAALYGLEPPAAVAFNRNQVVAHDNVERALEWALQLDNRKVVHADLETGEVSFSGVAGGVPWTVHGTPEPPVPVTAPLPVVAVAEVVQELPGGESS